MNDIKILLIDDQPEITDIVEEFINDKYENMVTVTTNDPKHAIELLNTQEFSLIITDHHMPEVSGIDVLRNVRDGNSVNNDRPIVFLTAMKIEVEAEISGQYEDVIIINKVDQIQKIIDVIEKYLC
jgi:CheY-like chemotaxis protein